MDASDRVRALLKYGVPPRNGHVESALILIDDDESVPESPPDLLKEFSFQARAFSSAQEFLASDCVNGTGCLILDIAMPGMTGFDLRAFESGAKPFSDTALLASVDTTLRKM
jgi:hypothetical protein